jgi:Flp pilus assembly protein TadB
MELIWLAAALAAAGTLFAVMAMRFRQGRAERLRRPGAATAHPDQDQEPIEEPPRPISEMTDKELAEWARGDPEKLRRLMRRYERPRRSAAASAFTPAFILGTLGTSLYNVVIQGDDLLHDLSLREGLTLVGVVVVLWLVFWGLIVLRRRGSA